MVGLGPSDSAAFLLPKNFEFLKLTEKIRGYKKQVDETTDNANQAMTKYKKLANDLDNWNERAEMAEDAVKQARNKAKQLINC